MKLIDKTETGQLLTRVEAEALMEELLAGRLETSEILRVFVAMNARPVAVEELAGFATVMRRHAAPVFAAGAALPEHMVDTCGTGGDNCNTFNISTAAAFVAAAAGARVAKHGNRGSRARNGSADVLEALGVRIDKPLACSGESIRKLGIGFLFAQSAHAAARHASPARKEIGVRTVFNLLGPLTNPAGAQGQVVGVFSDGVMDLVATTLAELGTRRAFVVHGDGGLDEISLSGETQIAEVKDGAVRRFTVTPEDFGMKRAPLEALSGGDATVNAEIILKIFSGEAGAPRDIVVMNAAAALVAANVAKDFREGVELAGEVIASGAVMDKLEALKEFQRDYSE